MTTPEQAVERVEFQAGDEISGEAGGTLLVNGEPLRRAEAKPMMLADPTPAQMLMASIQRGDDLAKLEKLMDLRDRFEATEARKAYVRAMAEFKAHPPTIIKDKLVGYENRDGSFTGYKHATLAEVATKIAAGLAAVGISHRWDVQHEARAIIVSCILTHELGHSESVTMPPVMPDDSGKKNAIQQVASAITYQQRYSLLAITGLAARDQDDDGRASGDPPETLSDAQLRELEQVIKDHGVDRAAFLRFARVDQLSDIPAVNFEAAKAEIIARKGKGKGGTSAPQARRRATVAGDPVKITPAQLRELEKTMDSAGVSERGILTRYEVDRLEALNTEQFERAMEYIAGLHP